MIWYFKVGGFTRYRLFTIPVKNYTPSETKVYDLDRNPFVMGYVELDMDTLVDKWQHTPTSKKLRKEMYTMMDTLFDRIKQDIIRTVPVGCECIRGRLLYILEQERVDELERFTNKKKG